MRPIVIVIVIALSVLFVPTAVAGELHDCEGAILRPTCDITGPRRPGVELPEEIDLSDPFPDLDEIPEVPGAGPIPTIIPPNPDNLPTADDLPDPENLPDLPVLGPVP